jgi:hypothetical protein
MAFLRRFSQICHPVFTSLDFATIILNRSRPSALLQTPNLENQVSVCMSPSDGVAQLYRQAPGSLFVAFYYSQGYGGGILTRLSTGYTHYIYIYIYTNNLA